MDCLYADGEDHTNAVVCDGIMNPLGLNPVKLEKHKTEIQAMLAMLPEEFFAGSGGGYSFLAACNDRNGVQWTGLHMRMEQLFQLGEGIGAVKALLPRELWPMLPGGMPYYQIVLDKPKAT